MSYTRRKTREVSIGNIKIGGNNPIAVQSMTNTDTRDAKKTIEQIKRLEEAGCDAVRVAVPDMVAAQNLGKIKKSCNSKTSLCGADGGTRTRTPDGKGF